MFRANTPIQNGLATLSALAVFLHFVDHVSATIAYFSVPNYRSINESPFAGFDEFYLEDFEDGLLNTPNVSSPNGFVVSSGDVRSVDGDDGVIDGISNGFGAFASSAPVTPFHVFYFTPDEMGRFPTYVGLVVTREPGIDLPFDTYGGRTGTDDIAISSRGFNVDNLTSVSGDFGNVEFAHFVGISSTTGISGFGVSRALQVDHLQYSYAAVPEPTVVLIGGLSALFTYFRRRRT